MRGLLPRLLAAVALFLALGAAPQRARAQATLITGLGGPADFGPAANTLAVGDDNSSLTAIDLTPYDLQGICFFGSSHSTMFINNNGNITFNAAVGTFTPSPFPVASQPMIAPYWGDVDTRGTVWPGPGAAPTGWNRVYWDIRQVGGLGQLVVTWFNVGYYGSHSDKLNSFQLVIREVSAATPTTPADYDVEFRYNRLEWTTGDASGGAAGLGGTPAQAGFDAGDNLNFTQLPGSRTAGVLNLLTTSNVGTPGVWRYRFHSCYVQCAANTDCGGPTPICDMTTRTCRPCTGNADCSGSTPVCNRTTGAANFGRCVQCTANANCSTNMCSATNTCVCSTNADCSGGTPICDLTSRTCRACDAAVATDCTGATPVCGGAGRCVQCAPGRTAVCTAPNTACSPAGNCVQCATGQTMNCSGVTPACNASTFLCRPCATATQALDCPNAAAPLCLTAGAMAGACAAATVAITAPTAGFVTANRQPTVTGTAPPGSTVIIYIDGTEVGRTTATAAGTFSFMLPTALSLGAHTVAGAAVVGMGAGPQSPMVSFRVVGCLASTDCSGMTPVCNAATNTCRGCSVATQATDCPTAPTTACNGATGACTSATVALTAPAMGSVNASGRPAVTGTGTPGQTVTVTVDGMALGTAVVDAMGNWTLPYPAGSMALGNGMHTVRATSGAAMASVSFIVGCAANSDCAGSTPLCNTTTNTCRGCNPAMSSADCPTLGAPFCSAMGATSGTCVANPPVVTTPANGSHSTLTRPNVGGTAAPGATVRVYVDGMPVGTAMADAMGNWSFPLGSSLGAGMHTLTAANVNAGTEGPQGSPVTFTVDPCTATTDCAGATPVCDATSRTCRPCDPGTATDCSAPRPVCSTTGSTAGRCIATTPTITSPADGSMTGSRRPDVRGVATPGSTVSIQIDGMEVGRADANANGDFVFTPTTDLNAGNHTVAAAPVTGATADGGADAGMVGMPGPVVRFVVTTCTGNMECSGGTPICDTASRMCRTCNPATESMDCPDPMLPLCSTSGTTTGRCVARPPAITSPTEGSTTTSRRPPITGTGTPGQTVVVTLDGMEVGRATVGADGTWTLTPTRDLPSGMHTLGAGLVDAMGMLGAPTSTVHVTVPECFSNTDCTMGTCNTSTGRCTTADGGTDGGSDASSDVPSDLGRTDGRTGDGAATGDGAPSQLTGAGACGCRAPGLPTGGSERSLGVALGALGLALALRRRKSA